MDLSDCLVENANLKRVNAHYVEYIRTLNQESYDNEKLQRKVNALRTTNELLTNLLERT